MRRIRWGYLKEWTLVEELSQNASARPDVDGGAVAFLAEQKLRRPVPQCYHLVRVWTLLVVGLQQGKLAESISVVEEAFES